MYSCCLWNWFKNTLKLKKVMFRNWYWNQGIVPVLVLKIFEWCLALHLANKDVILCDSDSLMRRGGFLSTGIFLETGGPQKCSYYHHPPQSHGDPSSLELCGFPRQLRNKKPEILAETVAFITGRIAGHLPPTSGLLSRPLTHAFPCWTSFKLGSNLSHAKRLHDSHDATGHGAIQHA